MARAGISKPVFLLMAFCFMVAVMSADQPGTPEPSLPATEAPPYEIQLFAPDESFIHSDQINDAVNGRNGTEMLFATSYGLSTYNGSWSTRHRTRDNTSEGLLDDFITAVEYDPDGNLWIGYAGGIQIYDGKTYRTIRDQQLLKDTRINALQRWNDTMWVATGNAGIHRYRNGTWTWFQPMSKGGPGFYETDSMAVDPVGNTLVIATINKGVWIVNASADPLGFTRIDSYGDLPPLLHVRQNPLGGAYIFDDRTISRYSAAHGLAPFLSVSDLTPNLANINDVTATLDDTLYIATDNGIFIWKDGALYRHLGGVDGIGTSEVIRRVFADSKGRIWFSARETVGYYAAKETALPVVTVHLMEQTTAVVTVTTPEQPPLSVTTATPAITLEPVKATEVKEPSLLDRFAEILKDILSKFGI